MSILSRIQQLNKVEFTDTEKIETTKTIGKQNLMELVNGRLEDFIHLVFFRNQMYVMGYIGYTCIVKRIPVETEGSTEPFEIAVNRDVLKILNNRDNLTLTVDKGELTWTFQYGEGMITRNMKGVVWRQDSNKYLEFILNAEKLESSGVVTSDQLRGFNKILKSAIADEKNRNVVVGKDYLYAVSPTFALYKKMKTDTDMLLTETILSNLPRSNTSFDCKSVAGFQGLIGGNSPVYYIFKEMTTGSNIKPYAELGIKWIADLPTKIEEAISIICFNEIKQIDLVFDEQGTVTIIDEDNPSNAYLSLTNVRESKRVDISSIIMKFGDMKRIGYIPSMPHLKAIEFKGGEICLM